MSGPRTATSTFTQLLSFVLQRCFKSTETVRAVRDGEPRTATSTSTLFLSAVLQRCFKSTETVRAVRDGEPRTATSTSTLFLSAVLQRCFTSTETVGTQYQGRGAQDGHLDFDTVSERCSSTLLYVHRDRRDSVSGTGSPGRPPRLRHCF